MCKQTPYECKKFLRTEKNYEIDLKHLQNGIKSDCVFNRKKNFHIIRNLSIDIMHDIFEGTAEYTMVGILIYFILVSKQLDLDEVNRRIENFNYGILESKNKPQPLSLESCDESYVTKLKKSVKCKQSAAGMACLVRYFGLHISR